MGTPEGLDGEEPAQVERTGVAREESVVLEHDGNGHVRHDESIQEHEEDDHGLREEVGAHLAHLDVPEEGPNERIEGAGERLVEGDGVHGGAEDETDVEESELEGNEGKELGENVGEDDEELREEGENSEAKEYVEVIAQND